MSLNLLRNLGCISVLSLSLVAGCGADDASTDLAEESVVGDAVADDKADAVSIAFTAFSDDIGSAGAVETRRTFTTSGAYKAFFGHEAPGVDFSREWVVFYSAGVKRTGGYTASVARISKSGATLSVVTSLESPGADCFVTQALTKPHVLVKFSKPRPAPVLARYSRSDSTRDCSAPSCATVRCAAGTHCELKTVYCIKAPCPPQPQCVPDPTCPGHGVFNATSGKCECPPNRFLCITGTQWNSDPDVCACSSLCDTVRCAAGTHCEANGNAVSCVADGPGACGTVADCVKSDNYCGGCACEAKSVYDAPTTCTNPVACFAQPCAVDSRTLACINNKCTLR